MCSFHRLVKFSLFHVPLLRYKLLNEGGNALTLFHTAKTTVVIKNHKNWYLGRHVNLYCQNKWINKYLSRQIHICHLRDRRFVHGKFARSVNLPRRFVVRQLSQSVRNLHEGAPAPYFLLIFPASEKLAKRLNR